MDFQYAKSKKSLVFAEFLIEENVVVEEDSFPDEYIFLISTYDPWYGDILVYLQTLKCPAFFSQENRCNLQVNEKIYLIIDDTLY